MSNNTYLPKEIKIELLKIALDVAKNEDESEKGYKVSYNKAKVLNYYWEIVELFLDIERQITVDLAQQSIDLAGKEIKWLSQNIPQE
jgi:hypothetical protein